MPPAVIAAGIGGLGSVVGGVLNSHAQNKAQQQQADLQNQYLDKYSQAQNDYRDYFSKLGAPTSYSNSNSVTNESGTSTTDPHVLAGYQNLINSVNNTLQSRLASPTSTMPGYLENATMAANDTYAGAKQAAANTAARYGLSGPAAAALSMPIDTARARDISNIRAEFPMKMRQLQDQDMQQAATLANMFGKGQTTNSQSTSHTSSSGQQTGPAPIMPFMAPPSPYQGGPVSPVGNMIAGGLGASGDFFNNIAQYLGQNARTKATGNTGFSGGVTGGGGGYSSGSPFGSSTPLTNPTTGLKFP